MILSLMSHNEARRNMPYWTEKHQPIFKMIRFCLFALVFYYAFTIYDFALRETMGLKQFSVEDINTVLGVFLVNDFGINSMVRNLIKDDF